MNQHRRALWPVLFPVPSCTQTIIGTCPPTTTRPALAPPLSSRSLWRKGRAVVVAVAAILPRDLVDMRPIPPWHLIWSPVPISIIAWTVIYPLNPRRPRPSLVFLPFVPPVIYWSRSIGSPPVVSPFRMVPAVVISGISISRSPPVVSSVMLRWVKPMSLARIRTVFPLSRRLVGCPSIPYTTTPWRWRSIVPPVSLMRSLLIHPAAPIRPRPPSFPVPRQVFPAPLRSIVPVSLPPLSLSFSFSANWLAPTGTRGTISRWGRRW